MREIIRYGQCDNIIFPLEALRGKLTLHHPSVPPSPNAPSKKELQFGREEKIRGKSLERRAYCLILKFTGYPLYPQVV